MSSKKKSGPKHQHLENINRKAFLAMNRAGALEQAYMNISAAIQQTIRSVKEEEKPADEALDELIAHWQYIDGLLFQQFQNIEQAVQPVKRVTQPMPGHTLTKAVHAS